MTIRKSLYIFIFLLAVGACPSQIFAKYVQYENQVIEKLDIIFEGLPKVSSYGVQSVKARIKTKVGSHFTQSDFDKDLKVLAQSYDRIEPTLKSVNGKMHITIKLWQRPIIKEIVWEGNKRVSSSDLECELGVSPGSQFDRLAFNRAFHKLKEYYVTNGYFEAKLNYRICPVEGSNEVNIIIQVHEGRAGRIKKICFRGFTRSERSELFEMIYTKEYSFVTSWLTGEGTYNEEAIQQDQFIILNYLQNKGYADAEVDIKVIDAKEPNRIIIVISAVKGQCYSFGNVTFDGNTVFDDYEIQNRLCIVPGQYYSPEKIRRTIDRITNMYGRCGYIDAYVNFEPKLEVDCPAYSVHFTIDEGEKYHVGMIKVFGNCSTQTNVILHEILLVPGEVFNQEKLIKTEIRLRNIGYFKNVNVYAVRPQDQISCLEGNYRDVHIEVEETTTGNFGAFFGFSTAENLFGGFNITERNFNYRGLDFVNKYGLRALRGGGEYLHFTSMFGTKSRKYVVSWAKPYFNDSEWTLGIDIDRTSTRYISNNYDLNSGGITIHTTQDYNPFLKLGYHYRLRRTVTDITGKVTEDLREQAEKDGIISAIGASVIYDSTDSPRRPSCGFRSRLEAEYSGLGGSFFFASFAYLNSYYYPIDESSVLKIRSDFRFIQPIKKTSTDDLPLDERIFMGGDNEVRGYKPYKIGPQFNDDDEPSGGISMQLFSAEIQHRVWSNLDAFTFIDAGHLSDAHWDITGRFYTSVGVGIRLQVLQSGPPLTFGYGIPLNPKERDDEKRFFFSMGGKF